MDGVATTNISGKRYIDHWIEAGFERAPPIKNSGAGAAMMRIEAARRVFSRCCFNAALRITTIMVQCSILERTNSMLFGRP